MTDKGEVAKARVNNLVVLKKNCQSKCLWTTDAKSASSFWLVALKRIQKALIAYLMDVVWKLNICLYGE